MRILFTISLIALAALLWASVSIAQHIYRSRRRQKTPPRENMTQPLTKIPTTPSASAPEETDRQRKAS
jgi:hypothetical protein